jgi:type VI secretion system secreted protein VgrG
VEGPQGEEIHTDARGRVRVQLHWDREGAWDHQAGKWMRVAQRGVASSMMYPRTGWNVMTFMEEGNVDAPTVLSRVHDAAHPPTYPLPANKTRTVFRSATSPGGGSANEIRFEDLAGIQEFFINASRDMNYVVEHNNTCGVARNHDKSVGGTQTTNIGGDLFSSVGHDQKVKIAGKEHLEIAANRGKSVGGSEEETIAGNRKVKVGSNIAVSVEKNRELEVAGMGSEKSREGLFNMSAQTAKLDIGGSLTQRIDGIHAEQVTRNANKTVGANKVESCKASYGVEVNGRVSETIGGNLAMTAGKNFMDGADTRSDWRVTSAIIGTTPHLHVQATESIVLKVGGSTVTITPRTVSIMAPSYDLSQSAATVAVTKIIRHN